MDIQTLTSHIAIVGIAACAFSPTALYAWGREGHETVAYIAAKTISGTRAEKEIKKILKPGESLATAAVWPDCAKGKQYCGAEPDAEMKSFTGRNPKHHTYHYTDVPIQDRKYDDTDVGADPNDLVHVLPQAIATLRGSTDTASNPHPFTKREALFLIAHLVGDLHQPFHAGDVYLDARGHITNPTKQDIASGKVRSSRGANQIHIGSKAFHSYWDSTLVDAAMKDTGTTTPASFAKKLLAKHVTVAKTPGKPETWPIVWENEMLPLAREAMRDVHVEAGTPDGTTMVWPATLPTNYKTKETQIVEQQLIVAGTRLGRVLKAIWP